MVHFINRERELQFLTKKYNSPSAELIIIYGRRRIGKTELITRFCKNKNSFYFMGRLESRQDTITRFNTLLAEQFNDTSLMRKPLTDFDAILDYINQHAQERLVCIIDEFPFLVDRFPEIVSILQERWDTSLRHSQLKLILSGSSVSMMEKHALDYKSPLYGRRSGQWKVDTFTTHHLKEFFPRYSMEDIVYTYATIDAIPGYLALLDCNMSIWENLEDKMFSKGEFLYEEAEILLREEMRDPSNYMTIIGAIAGGLNSFNEIYQKTSLDKSLLSKYLGVLESLNIIRRIAPVTEGIKHRMRNTLYEIRDNFYDFWFRFVYPNKQDIERGKPGILKGLKRDIDQYVGFKFEEFCTEYLATIYEEYDAFGKWWHKGSEIDIVALDRQRTRILFCECKWSHDVDATRLARELVNKSKEVEWHNADRQEHYILCAKSFTKKITEHENHTVSCIDLDDMR